MSARSRYANPEPVWAVVALKSPERAKTRLAGWLSPAQRRQLLFTLAERSIKALHATPGIGRICVISASDEVASFARTLGALPLMQSVETGTAGAFASAIDQLRPFDPQKLLMLAGDLPLVCPSALQALCDAAGQAQVVIAPDRHRLGTNALLCAPPRAIAPSFGSDSFHRHRLAAESAALRTKVLDLDALSLDLDRPDDFEELQRRASPVSNRLMAALQTAENPAFRKPALPLSAIATV